MMVIQRMRMTAWHDVCTCASMPMNNYKQLNEFTPDPSLDHAPTLVEVEKSGGDAETKNMLMCETDERSLLQRATRIRTSQMNDASISFVQLYGERNSATSFLSKVLRDNMKKPQNFLGLKASESTPLGTKFFGYKHWFTKPEMFKDPRQEETLFVIIYRNPYTWIRAMMDRPYALSNAISGRSVEELPGLKLVGHVNGKDTLNEFHPDTGEKLDIFQLRRLKIENFESVQRHVGNIAFVNMETLLHNPVDTLRALASEFGTLFTPELNLENIPPKVLIRELRKPALFSAAETGVINANIDWKAESLIGYEKNNYFLKHSERLKFMILHGSSAVGKSYTLSKLLKDYSGLDGIEMDDCRYWDEYEPNFEEQRIKSIFPDMSADAYQEMKIIISKAGIKAQRNIEFLLCKLQELFSRSSISTTFPATVVATCGALPFPGLKDELSIYQWLEEQLPVSFHHTLIEVPEELHVSRMEKRGRIHLKGEILKNNSRRTELRTAHNEVVSDYKEIVTILDKLRNSD